MIRASNHDEYGMANRMKQSHGKRQMHDMIASAEANYTKVLRTPLANREMLEMLPHINPVMLSGHSYSLSDHSRPTPTLHFPRYEAK